MTRSMYYRSLAAQHQAKAGDQWAFFQAKRTRGTTLEATADLLDRLAHPEPFTRVNPLRWFERVDSYLVYRVEPGTGG